MHGLGGKSDQAVSGEKVGGNENFDQVAMGRADAEKQFQEAIEEGRESGEKMCTDMISLACQVCFCSSLKVEESMEVGSRKAMIS